MATRLRPHAPLARFAGLVFVGSCVGLAALVGVLVVLTIIDWSGA